MKHLLYIFLFIAVSCKDQTPIKSNSLPEDKTKDTIIYTSWSDTITTTTAELKKVSDNFSTSTIAINPDQAYYCDDNLGSFNSEVGKDQYYILYAHLLQKRNGIEKYDDLRTKLTDIYQNINSLFGDLQHGGTYFGHQNSRIFGYVEYSIYLYSRSKDNFEKNYNIEKQKQIYIASLRQLIDDELSIDTNTFGEEKAKRRKKLNQTVDSLEKLISDIFYLRRAQQFQSEYYQYY
ncbi:hypothetical protein [uncultured Flavobacterium sp.]|uniref:hypothetical protein n=1 Tax=uncultured Flavobacterium sp. TaxID=165435 RepID=UPI00120F2D4D|nr:hypothetical protein [uncultured Flavobacterium sp.]THD34024.1 MAG: hypothetical protein DI588_02460 [Flavobacterium johnsoniae]